MKRILVLATAGALLAACSATSPAGKAVIKTVSFTEADLTNATAISKAAGDVDHGVECFTWMNSELPALQAALAPATPATVSGVFSALEAANVANNSVQAGIPPALKAAAEVNCGPYFLNVEGGINALLLKAGAAALPIALP